MTRSSSRRDPLRSATHALLRSVALLFVVGIASGLWAGWQLYLLMGMALPGVERLATYEPPQTTRIFASDGTLIGTLFHENRTVVPLSKVSPHVVHALLAIEDARFFEHEGVDLHGIVRAAVANLRGSGIEQGASTITMQLARALFLDDERTLTRKVREALLALRLEQRYSKRVILTHYLNQVYFGSGSYGISSAASNYYGKRASQLTPAQAAMLAGLLQAPTRLSPHVDRRAALKRQLVVLQRMRDLEFLTAREHHLAVREAVRKQVRPRRDQVQAMLKYPYFTSAVVAELSKRFPDEVLYEGGLNIYTTLDIRMQKRAEAILRQRIQEEGGWYNAHQAAAVVLENQTGFVRAMVGGTGWSSKSQFNRATQAFRQPGSAFKVFVYAAALEQGMTPETIVPDSPVTLASGMPWEWSPSNSDRRFMGAIPIRMALQMSRNVVAVKVLQKVGVQNVIATARKMGLRGRMDPYPSLALGASEATPLEMASAFSVFVNGGLFRTPYTVKLVTDSHGRVLEDRRRTPLGRRALSERTARRMVEMLQRVVTAGTGRAAAVSGFPVAGKTGTTENHRDAWFVGFTPQYSLAVWVGNDDFKPMWQAYGGDMPARIWSSVMAVALQGRKPRPFPSLAGLAVEKVRLCRQSHLRAGPKCPSPYSEFFRAGSEPVRTCPVHHLAPTPRPSSRPSSLQADVDRDGVLTNSDLRREYGASVAPPAADEVAER